MRRRPAAAARRAARRARAGQPRRRRRRPLRDGRDPRNGAAARRAGEGRSGARSRSTAAASAPEVPLEPGANLIDISAGARGRRPDFAVARIVREVRLPVPDLAGRDADTAQEQLEGLGLTVELEDAGGFFDPLLPGDPKVCELEPEPGTQVLPGSDVTVRGRARLLSDYGAPHEKTRAVPDRGGRSVRRRRARRGGGEAQRRDRPRAGVLPEPGPVARGRVADRPEGRRLRGARRRRTSAGRSRTSTGPARSRAPTRRSSRRPARRLATAAAGSSTGATRTSSSR